MSDEWTERGKKVASLLSYGMILSIVIIIIGAVWTGLEILVSSGSGTNFIDWFLGLDWTLMVLVVGGLIVGAFVGIIGFQIFIRKGHRFFMKYIFKLEP